jgi:hypothetical protein
MNELVTSSLASRSWDWGVEDGSAGAAHGLHIVELAKGRNGFGE